MRTLLDLLAERAPGGRLELRVPPHAAVQCIEHGEYADLSHRSPLV